MMVGAETIKDKAYWGKQLTAYLSKMWRVDQTFKKI